MLYATFRAFQQRFITLLTAGSHQITHTSRRTYEAHGATHSHTPYTCAICIPLQHEVRIHPLTYYIRNPESHARPLQRCSHIQTTRKVANKCLYIDAKKAHSFPGLFRACQKLDTSSNHLQKLLQHPLLLKYGQTRCRRCNK